VSDQVFWFAARGAGIVCWVAAAFSILIGLLMPTRALGRRPTLPWLLDLHRYFGAMSMVFLAVHMVALWADAFVDFAWSELFVPGVAEVPGLSRWSLALGVGAGWLLALVELSSLVKKHISARLWHTVHLSAFGVVIAGAVHAVEAGSDSDNRYLVAAGTSVAVAVALLTIVRFSGVLLDRKYRYEAALGDEEWADPSTGYDAGPIEPLSGTDPSRDYRLQDEQPVPIYYVEDEDPELVYYVEDDEPELVDYLEDEVPIRARATRSRVVSGWPDR
jgi:hypothetical protein